MHCSCVAAVLALLAYASPASAQPDKVFIPQDALQEQDPAGAALVDAFGRFCLDRFPGAQRVEDAAPGHVAALPPGRVRDYLHDAGATHEISCRFCTEFLGYPARSLSM